MCLAVPMKVVKVEGDLSEVEIGGIKKQVSLQLLNEVKIGDYLIVHAGYAIQKLDKKDAEETLSLLRKMAEEY